MCVSECCEFNLLFYTMMLHFMCVCRLRSEGTPDFGSQKKHTMWHKRKHWEYISTPSHHVPRCCGPVCRPLRMWWTLRTLRCTPRSDTHFPWSRIEPWRWSASWCPATCPGDPQLWWALQWSARTTPWPPALQAAGVPPAWSFQGSWGDDLSTISWGCAVARMRAGTSPWRRQSEAGKGWNEFVMNKLQTYEDNIKCTFKLCECLLI